MKPILSIICFCLMAILSHAQSVFIKKEFCKKAEVELMAGNCLPEGYAIVGTSSFKRSDGLDELSELSEKQIKLLRSHGKMFKSCHVFVDFKGEIMPLTDGAGISVHIDHIAFYALQPMLKFNPPKE
jgi:hypothetical protein